MKNLDNYGEWALITGASSGIGEAFARSLAFLGLNVILVARRKAKLDKISDELKSNFNVETLVVVLDLTQDNFMDLLLDNIGDKKVGLLINNAGFGSIGLYTNNNADHEADMVKLHCLVPTVLTHHFARQMIKQRQGGIIFVGSIFSYQAMPFVSTYAATKVFNTFLGKSLWYEFKKYNVDVLALNPGGTKTEFSSVTNQSNSSIADDPMDVVVTALKYLGKRPSVIHGFRNKIWWIVTRLMPPRMSLIFHGWFIKTTAKIKV
jgi:uncharacterized protein